MPELTFIGHRKATYYQSTITAEANTDAGGTWGAPESTLANSEKAKINLILTALRSAGIISTAGGNRVLSLASLRAVFFQTNIAAVATADSDATYGQPEADLLNEMKAKLNSAIAALRSARVINGRQRIDFVAGRKVRVTQTNIASITIADADATYTSGGAGEQGLANDIKRAINEVRTAMIAAGIIV